MNILLSSANYQSGTGKMVYTFPSALKMTGKEVALQAFSFYNSFYNISSALGNNVITVRVPIFTASNTYTMTDYACTLPNGYYSITDLNNALQNFCILNGFYLYDTINKKNIYFVALVLNSVQYAFQLNTYYIPTASQASALLFTSPGGFVLNTGNQMVSAALKISSGLGVLLGMASGTYPATTTTSTAGTWSTAPAFTQLSTTTPQINGVNALILRTNLIANTFSIPNDCLALIPLTASYGSVNQYSAFSLVYSDIQGKAFDSIEVYFTDQNGNYITFIDNELTLCLTIREKQRTS